MDAQFHVNKNSKTITIRPKPATTVRKESQNIKSNPEEIESLMQKFA